MTLIAQILSATKYNLFSTNWKFTMLSMLFYLTTLLKYSPPFAIKSWKWLQGRKQDNLSGEFGTSKCFRSAYVKRFSYLWLRLRFDKNRALHKNVKEHKCQNWRTDLSLRLGKEPSGKWASSTVDKHEIVTHVDIQLYKKRLSQQIVDTWTERNFGYSHNEW